MGERRKRARRDTRVSGYRGMYKELDFVLKKGSGGNFNNSIQQHNRCKNRATWKCTTEVRINKIVLKIHHYPFSSRNQALCACLPDKELPTYH